MHPLLALLALLALGACGRSGDGGAASEPRPGVPLRTSLVLIVVDTLRADAVFDPEERYETPHLDRLAREGVPFARAFSAAPMTLPAHMSLFSSRPVHETGVLTNGQDVPVDLPLLAEWLAEHGYDTRAVLSMATLGVLNGTRSPARGFAVYEMGPEELDPAESTFARLRASLAARDPARPLFLFAHFSDPHEPYEAHGTRERRVELTMAGAPVAELLASDMQVWRGDVTLGPGRTEFLLRPRERGLRFVVRSFECLEDGRRLEVERPDRWKPAKEARIAVERGDRPSASCELRVWVADVPSWAENRRRYALEVAHADRYVGELLAELERLGLYRDTLVVFTSDHGESLGEHGHFGHVENLSDGLIRVPLIVKLPAGDPREPALRAAAAGLVSHIDLVPTVLEALGLPPLPGQRGRSLFAPHPAVHVAQTSRPEARRTQLAFRDERFKMVYFPDEERFELYDLVADPGELCDVFAARQGERPSWPALLREAHQGMRAPASDLPEAERARREELLKALGY